MDAEDWLRGHWVDWLAGLGIDKAAIRDAFLDAGLGPLWALARELYLNPYLLIVVFPILLIAERRWPVQGQRAARNTILDFCYPLLSLPVKAIIVVGLIEAFNQGIAPLELPLQGILNKQPLWLQLVGGFLAADLLFYLSHRLLHQLPWLWHFHKIHHSQTQLNPFTLYRSHPFERMLHALIQTIPAAWIGGSYPSWFLLTLLINGWGLVIHANIRTNLGLLRFVWVTPQAHRVHHSIETRHINKNFGEHLIVWDMLFGSWEKNTSSYPATGVSDFSWTEQNLGGFVRVWAYQTVYPFLAIARSIQQFVGRMWQARFELRPPAASP